MANLSDLTRKEQVLQLLQTHVNEWVDGPNLANEEVGGSEGLKRLRELRAEGHRIVTRTHPDPKRDIFQYKLVVGERIAPQLVARIAGQEKAGNAGEAEEADVVNPGPATPTKKRPFPLKYDEKLNEYSVAGNVCVECEGIYYDEASHRTSKVHLSWIAKTSKLFADRPQQTEIPIDPQPPIRKFDKMPERIVVGDVVICPRCNGHMRKGRERFDRKKGQIIVTKGEDFTRDPFKPTAKNGEPNKCPRCNGFGVVPNLGGV